MKKIIFLFGACITFALAFALALGSCSTGEGTPARMLGGSSQALLYHNYRAVSEDEVEFVFSRPVTIKSISFTPDISVVSVENGSTVLVKLAQSPEPGRLITADLVAEDDKKNSINVLVTMRARNNRMPKLAINEVCVVYANAAAGKKAEFIELKMKSAGNLGAMRVFIIGNSNASRQTVYEFLPVEVKAGDYVVLHLRTFYPAESKNEYGANLAESGGVNSSPTARDFWIPGETKLIQHTSFVYVLDQDDNVLDAVLLCQNPDSPWPKDYFTEAAAFLFAKGAWKSSNGIIIRPSDAVPTTGTTNTRTINRSETAENTNSAADWFIPAANGSATPGGSNVKK